MTEVTTSGSVPAITGYTWNQTASTLASSSITLDENNKSGNFKATNIYDRDLETVTIGKTVAAGVAADGVPTGANTDKVYSITITADASIKDDVAGKSYSGVKYTTDPTTGEDVGVAFDATTGAYTASLKHGEKLDIAKLPTGKYTISENQTEGTGAGYKYWDLTVTGDGEVNVTKDGTNAFTVTNTYTREDMEKVTLTLNKLLKQLNVKGEGDAHDTLKALTLPTDDSKTYTFHIEGRTVFNEAVDRMETVTVAKGEASGSYDIEDLAYGTYTVTEVTTGGKVPAITGYTWYKSFLDDNQTKASAEVTLNETTKTGSVKATNVYERELGTVQVTKVFKNLTGEEVARLTNFELSVTGPADYAQYNGDTSLTLTEAVKDDSAKHPTYTWTLTDVPTGSYTVKEARKDIKLPEYNLTVKNGVAGGIITADAAGNFSQTKELVNGGTTEVFFQNAYIRQLGSLKLIKTVSGGPDSAKTQDYTFTITGPKDANGTYSDVTFTAGVSEPVRSSLRTCPPAATPWLRRTPTSSTGPGTIPRIRP